MQYITLFLLVLILLSQWSIITYLVRVVQLDKEHLDQAFELQAELGYEKAQEDAVQHTCIDGCSECHTNPAYAGRCWHRESAGQDTPT